MTALFIIMLTVFTAYIGFILIKYGIQQSVSNSWYKLPENLRWLFTIALWGFAIPAIVLGVEHSGLAFLAGSGICFVGAAPAFKDKGMEAIVHISGALAGVIGGILFMVFTGLWWVALITLALMAVATFCQPFIKNKTWWNELIAFYMYALTIYILTF